MDPRGDVEKAESEKAVGQVTLHGLNEMAPEGTVHRNLKARHIQMIAIGGNGESFALLGVSPFRISNLIKAELQGLFVGAGGALAQGGPLGLLLGYTIMGGIVFSMMVALGEMTTLFPVSGAFTHYASRFLDPAIGFGLGWNYWYSFAITLPTEITVAALVIDYWPGGQALSPAIFISVFLVVICSFNFLGVRMYGEAEFWFAIIKVITIVGLILLGLIITCGGGPDHQTIGFRFWKEGAFQQMNGIPGPKGRFLAFWSVFVQAAFSYLGTEIVALTAGEAANPRRNVPKAINRVFYRIMLFYVGGVFIMGLIVSPNDPQLLHNAGTAASPWVIAIKRAGINGLPSLINVVVLLSAFSAGNSDLYASSRTLYGLACDGKAPAFLRICTKSGLPIYCLCVTALFGPLAYMNLANNAATVFNCLITWGVILLTYIRFYHGCKRQGIDRSTFPFVAPFQPYASYAGLFMICLITFFCGYGVFLDNSWSTATFLTDYIPVWVFILFVAFWKLYKKTHWVSLDEMDFDTGRRELDEMADQEAAKYEAPTTLLGKVWDAIM